MQAAKPTPAEAEGFLRVYKGFCRESRVFKGCRWFVEKVGFLRGLRRELGRESRVF